MNNIKKLKLFLAEHYLALILASIVGLISVAPEALGIMSLGKNYQGIPFFKVNDNLFYAAKIQDILDGHGRANSPAFYEYKNESSLILPLGEYFYVLPAKLFNLNMADILVFNKFLLPAILFLIIYAFAIKLSGNGNKFSAKINAIAASLFVILGYDLNSPKNAWLLISGQTHYFITSLWTRPVNPITGGIFLFIFLLLVWKIINRGRWPLAVSAGLLLAMMLTYFFSWGAGLAVMAVLAVIYFIKKEYKIFAHLALVLAVSLIASFFYWYNLFTTMSSARGQEMALRSGLLYFHTPLFNKVLLVSLIIFLPCLIFEYIVKKRQNEKIENWWWFCLAMLVGGLLALNQQIITGRAVWPYHFVQYTIPFAIIALTLLFYNFIRPKFPWLWQAVVMIIIIFSLTYGVASARSYVFENFFLAELQNYAPAMNWLNENTPVDCVALTKDKIENISSPLASLIPAITHCNVYNSNWLALGMTPDERILHDYLITLRLSGISGNDIDKYLNSHQGEISGTFFKDIAMANVASVGKDDPYVLERIKQISSAYKDFLKNDFLTELKKYRLDYIISEGDLSLDNKNLLPQIKLIGEFNNIFLYKF